LVDLKIFGILGAPNFRVGIGVDHSRFADALPLVHDKRSPALRRPMGVVT
jgi:hypothetical protein